MIADRVELKNIYTWQNYIIVNVKWNWWEKLCGETVI